MTILSDFIAYCACNIFLLNNSKVHKRGNEKISNGGRIYSTGFLKNSEWLSAGLAIKFSAAVAGMQLFSAMAAHGNGLLI